MIVRLIYPVINGFALAECCSTGLQVFLNDGSGTDPMTDSLRHVLLDRVTAFGSNHALRCLALASRPMSPSSQQVCLKVCYCT